MNYRSDRGIKIEANFCTNCGHRLAASELTADPEFDRFNWGEVARLMGARFLGSPKRGEIEIFKQGIGRLIISDNGGEVNVSVVKPLVKESIPYTSDRITVNNTTMAYRLVQAIKRKKIDYDLQLDD